jgi:hypothetical protein
LQPAAGISQNNPGVFGDALYKKERQILVLIYAQYIKTGRCVSNKIHQWPKKVFHAIQKWKN